MSDSRYTNVTPKPLLEEAAKVLEHYRDGRSNQELAELTGLSPSTISCTMKGRRGLSADNLTWLMDRLGVYGVEDRETVLRSALPGNRAGRRSPRLRRLMRDGGFADASTGRRSSDELKDEIVKLLCEMTEPPAMTLSGVLEFLLRTELTERQKVEIMHAVWGSSE